MERWWNTWESALYNLWFWGTVPLDLIILTLRQEHKILEGDIIRTTLNCKPYRRTQAACQGYRQSDLPLLFPFVGSHKTLSQASKRSRPQGLLETNMLDDEYFLGSCVRTNKSLSSLFQEFLSGCLLFEIRSRQIMTCSYNFYDFSWIVTCGVMCTTCFSRGDNK